MQLKLFYVFGFVFCSSQFIRKCCDRGQQLNRKFDSCIDYDANEGIEKYFSTNSTYDKEGVNFVKWGETDKHHIWWLPPDITFLDATLRSVPLNKINDIRFLYNCKHPCKEQERLVVPFNDHVFLFDNGSLLIADITDNIQPRTMVYDSDTYCVDRVSLTETRNRRSTHLIEHSFAILLCPCLVLPCVRLCCTRKSFIRVADKKEHCQYSPAIAPEWSLDRADYSGDAPQQTKRGYGLLKGIPVCNNYTYLNDNSSKSLTKFWLLPNGNVRIQGAAADIQHNDYCIHYSYINETFQTNLRICDPYRNLILLKRTMKKETSSTYKQIICIIYFGLGAIFLGATLLVYGFVPELRKTTYSNILLNHVACLFVFYVFMVVRSLGHQFLPKFSCVSATYIVQHSFIASMLWLNVMCLYISNTYRISSSFKNLKMVKRCCLMNDYSPYVWGLTTTISLITFMADNTSVLSRQFRPKLSQQKRCWFPDSFSQFCYFYLPVTIIALRNLVLFLFTIQKIAKARKEAKRIFIMESKIYKGVDPVIENTTGIDLYTKLFGLMGVTWIFEALYWCLGPSDPLWYLTDALTSLRGLFIFVICCCKKETIELIKERFTKTKRNNRDMRNASACSTTNLIPMKVLKNSQSVSAASIISVEVLKNSGNV